MSRINQRMKSATQHQFSLVPQAHRSRSAFKCDHSLKTTFNNGYVVPFLWDEVNPGDTFKVSLHAMIRFATLLFPLMDNIKFYTHYFFIPNRLTWSNWVYFMGQQDTPGDSISFTVPKMTSTASTGYAEGSLYDYFGLPTKIAGYDHITLPLRAYNQTWNHWFRDENLQNPAVVRLGDSGDLDTDFVLQPSAKIRDYFTSCIPFTQKGTAVTVPIGTSAPVNWDQSNPVLFSDGVYDLTLVATSGSSNPTYGHVGGASTAIHPGKTTDGTLTGYVADLSAASGATINSLRQAFQIQRFLERDARGGTRYPELVFSHWGVSNPDARVQWPEYLGGSRESLYVNVVAQTAPASGGSTPLANLAGMGTAVIQDHGFTKSFTEHGILLGLIIARADLTYQQGLNRKWSRLIRYDYPFPVFAHLGEQAVLTKEIYCQGTAGGGDDASTFGYQERYAENRYFPNLITGLFRTNATGTLDSWHLAQSFGTKPTLGATFIVDNAPTTRVKATSSDPDFIMDAIIKQTVVSVLPTYSDPGYIDHM